MPVVMVGVFELVYDIKIPVVSPDIVYDSARLIDLMR
jgi:hypothetical protein